MAKLVEATLQIALSQEGVREQGENRGPQVDAYLRSAGVSPGNPWCAAFVYWCVEQAAQKLGQPNPCLRTAYCPDILHWGRERGVAFDRPVTGDIFLRIGNAGGEVRPCHTGFVTAVEGNSFGTVEGNTNIDGSREGIGVFRRTRQVGDAYRFVRWGEMTADVPAETYALVLSGRPLCDMPVIDGRSLAPVRLWGESLGFRVGWDNDAQSPTFDGQAIPVETTLIDGKAYAPIRDLVRSAGLNLAVDNAAHRVTVTR